MRRQTDHEVTVVLDTNMTESLIEEGFVYEMISKIQTFYKHRPNRLPVLNISGIPAGPAHHHNPERSVHILLQFLVNPCFLRYREITQMDALCEY